MEKVFRAIWKEEEVKMSTIGLTDKEALVMMGLRNSSYGDPILDNYTFRDGIQIDGMPSKAIIAVLSSLAKKSEVNIEYHDKCRSCVTISLNTAAKKRFSDYQNCIS